MIERNDFMRVADAAMTPKSALVIVKNQITGKSEVQTVSTAAQPVIYHASAALVGVLAKQDPAGLKAIRAVIAKAQPLQKSALEQMEGYSHPDAIREHKRDRADYASGKTKTCPISRQEKIRQFAETRRGARQRATAVSHQTALKVAAWLESLIPLVPKLREQMAEAQRAVYPDIDRLGDSPLLKEIDDLPNYIGQMVDTYRNAPAIRNFEGILPTE